MLKTHICDCLSDQTLFIAVGQSSPRCFGTFLFSHSQNPEAIKEGRTGGLYDLLVHSSQMSSSICSLYLSPYRKREFWMQMRDNRKSPNITHHVAGKNAEICDLERCSWTKLWIYSSSHAAHNKLFNKMGKVRVKEDLWEGQSSLADLINYCILKCLFTEVSSYKRSDVN